MRRTIFGGFISHHPTPEATENFVDLTPEQEEKYEGHFHGKSFIKKNFSDVITSFDGDYDKAKERYEKDLNLNNYTEKSMTEKEKLLNSISEIIEDEITHDLKLKAEVKARQDLYTVVVRKYVNEARKNQDSSASKAWIELSDILVRQWPYVVSLDDFDEYGKPI